MRIPISLMCCLFLFTIGIKAQNSPDCRSAIPVCADVPIIGTADGGGDIDDFDPDVIRQTGCLEKGSVSSANIENNTSWYVFRAGTTGQVGFDIEALPSIGTTITSEWDFAVYGPDIDCGDISNGTAQPIRCNYEVNTTAYTGLGVNPVDGREGAPFVVGSQNTYDEYIDVQEGEIYFILINNFNTNLDGDPESFTLTFTGESVNDNQDTALDCTLRDEFLGLDVVACEGDPDIFLTAMRSPAGPDIATVLWSVDYEDDGVIDAVLTGSGALGEELYVASPNSGRYYVEIQTTLATVITDDILVTFYSIPVLDRVEIVETNLLVDSDVNNVEFFVDGNSDYEYAINGGEFQDSATFLDVPPGLNTVIINDKNGCGITEPIEFFVVAYPKFFTPNGDSTHDLWNVEGIETLDNPIISIFDRYGMLLQQINGTSLGWDGNYNGRPMPSSDYWFKFEFGQDEQNDGVIVAKTLSRHFSLVR